MKCTEISRPPVRWGKTLRAAVLAACLAQGLAMQSIQAQISGLQPEITGSWFNPAQDGHGFSFQALSDDTMLVFWYTYNPDGTSTFLGGTATDDGTGIYVGELQQTEGMVFGDFDPDTVIRNDWGTMAIRYDGCDQASFSWTTSAPGFVDGTVPLRRLTQTHGFSCVDDPVTGNYRVTLDDGDGLASGTALFLPGGELFYAFGESAVDTVGFGSWAQTERLSISIDTISYEVGPVNIPPLERQSFAGGALLTINGFGGPEQSEIASTLFRGVPLPEFRRELPISQLAGNYTLFDDVVGIVFAQVTIDAQGRIAGTATGGCNLDGGQVESTGPATHQFAITVLADDDDPACDDLDLIGAGYRIHPEDPRSANHIMAIMVRAKDDRTLEPDYASVFRLVRTP